MAFLRQRAAAAARAAGVDLVRLRSVRHPIGRRARLMARLGVDLVIDVGANRGQFALEVRRAGYAGRMLSIEPLAEPFEVLRELAALDKRWAVIRAAAGSRSGSATIHVAANGGASSSILPMLDLHARVAPNATFVADEPVDISRLDDLVEPQVRDAVSVFTKVDVQGFELEVLAGGPATLGRSSLVQLEMSFLPLYDGAPTYKDVLEIMGQNGFLLVGIEPGLASGSGLLLQADGLFAPEPEIRRLQASQS